MKNFGHLFYGFQDIIYHQSNVQAKLIDKVSNGCPNPLRIANKWTKMHFGISMLDAVIEEAIEAKRLLPMRKWWASDAKLQSGLLVNHKGSDQRREFIEELTDIFIQFINALVFFGVSSEEFIEVLESKLAKNNPDNPNTDLGNRS